MSIQDRLRGIVKGTSSFIRQAISNASSNIPSQSANLDFYSLNEPPVKNASSYINSYRGWVYSCVKVTAQEVAKIEFVLFKRNKKGEVEIVDNHEILDLLSKINSFQTKMDFMEATEAYLKLVGEAFWYKLKVNGKTKELWQLRPDWISVLPPKNKGEFIGGYEYKVPGTGKKETFLPDEIIHMKYFNPGNPYRGIGTLQAAAYAYDIDEYSSKWNRNFFFNNALPNVILTTENSLSDKQITRLEAKFKSKYAGVDKAHKFAVLSGGLKFDEAFKMSLKDMEFIEARKFSRDEIFSIFQVPKTIASVSDDVNRAAALEHKAVWIENMIKPDMIRITSFLNEFLVNEWGEEYYLGFKDPSPDNQEADLKMVMEASDVLTVNERRELIGYDPIDKGDVIRVPFSLVSESVGQDKKSYREVEVKLKGKEKLDKGIIVNHRRTKGEIVYGKMKEVIKKEFKPELRKIAYMLMAKKTRLSKKDEELFKDGKMSQEMKENFWKQLIAKTDVFEGKMRNELMKLANEQRMNVMDNITEKDLKRIMEKGVKGVNDYLFNLKDEMNRFANVLTPELMNYISQQGSQALNFLNVPSVAFSITQNVHDFLDGDGSKFILSLNETTRDKLKEALKEGIGNGESIPELKNRVEEVYDDFNNNRAKVIARTEVLRASNFGTLEAYRQSGVVKGKEWLVALDERTCEFCLAMEKKYKERGLEDNFLDLGDNLVGTEGGVLQVDYTDLEVPPLHAQCRCTIVPILR